MDWKVSRKETRFQPDGNVDILMDDVFDLYPVFVDGDENLIADFEVLDSDTAELLDRAMFAVVKQRGADPQSPDDGAQWEEVLMGEVSIVALIAQVQAEVSEEGPGIKATYETVTVNNKELLSVKIELVASS